MNGASIFGVADEGAHERMPCANSNSAVELDIDVHLLGTATALWLQFR